MKRLRVPLAMVVVIFMVLWWSLSPKPVSTTRDTGTDTAAEQPKDPEVTAEQAREAAARTAATAELQRELEARAEAAATPRDALAKGFRETFPFHTQVLALPEPASDRSRTLIISEPPQDLTLGEVLAPLAKVLRNHVVHPTDIGNDGWVKDVVASISGSDADISYAL